MQILSRREKRLLELTVADTMRLVPFLVIAVVPFLEFSLPVLLKVFPNMLPSTYTTSEQERLKQNASLKIRMEMAKFLQSATSRMMEEERNTEVTEETAQEFLRRASQGLPVTNAEIIRVGKLLKEEFALNRISSEQLQAVARFFGVSAYGPKSYVVYLLNRKIKQLREDDALIAAEGIDKLSPAELAEANFKRGMVVEGRTRAQMEQQLEDWMELADADEVPPFLLLLSRSFSTNPDSRVAQEAVGQLAQSPRVETLLNAIPHKADVYERKLSGTAEEVQRSDLSKTFALVDSDGDGTIDAVELKVLMQHLGESFPQQQIDSWVRKADTNGDGEINFKEFVAVMREAIQNASDEVPLAGVESEIARIRKDILEARQNSARTSVKVLDKTEEKLRSTIKTMIDHIEKDLGDKVPPLEATVSQGAGPKASGTTVPVAKGELWKKEELWGGDSQAKQKQ